MVESGKSVFWSKFSAVALVILIVLVIISFAVPNTTEVVKYQDKFIDKPVNVTIEKFVDNENLDTVLKFLYDNLPNGNTLDYLIEDLDDDEYKEITSRILFVDEVKKLAIAEVELEADDELEDYFDDEVDRIRVQDDDDEVLVDASSIDWEDKDVVVIVFVKFEQDGDKYLAEFEVEFKDGEVDDLDLEEVTER